MQKNNQYWETSELIVDDLNILFLENKVNENLVSISQNAPKKKKGDLDDDDDTSKINNPQEDMESDEDDQSDTIEIDENYPGPKESDIDQAAEKPGINHGNQEG
ncbi:MAG TPA: hypothetical protein VKZ95_00625 [Sphingobacteriaceae bacterium]|nr:hypothetical protein [Sphingobacteriaceae bacterium]